MIQVTTTLQKFTTQSQAVSVLIQNATHLALIQSASTKEEVMPILKIIIPKGRDSKKKKVVKVTRKVSKEYTNFQIVNQMNGISELFG